MLHLHETFARDEEIAPEYVCVRACVCVRTYVGVAVTLMLELQLTPESGWSGRDYGVCFESQHDKTNKVVVRPAKTQISLGIRPV